ncbi:MAG TPA: murein biosynthesis integral membrane protein MurJ [Candidatus Pacearchaeota archaeon]|nr:murein biosynthesis integral membrane protein MurJ [Candidatus Parcubacteria bacterium]HOU46117.1 murein biosynthesis integral membrane protein MurJ [Candidatus Pacearchaeota archaeon]HPM08658.1 murein biosynthesis integral membrane protein MurJ [Candidatus Pacearchaeota archaeon]HQI74677.1 murein biosynthesis integral membrane protein MurJ [Candidatus Pacearchaeota archaeon]
MIKKIINAKTQSVATSAIIISIAALASKFLGLIRDGLVSGYFGTSSLADVYFTAFKIPDFIFNFLIAGGLSIVFLPVFSEYMHKEKEEAWKMVNNVLNVFLFFVILLCLIAFVFAEKMISIAFPGFSGESFKMLVSLTRILLLSPIFFSFSSIFSSILMYFEKFFIYSFAPLIYNFFIILGIIFIAPKYSIYGPAIGAVFGALAHFLIQVPSAIESGYKYKFIFNFKESGIKKIFTLMIPRTIASAGQQINELIITGIASTLAVGSIAVFNYANNIRSLPIGFFSIPLSIAVFPALSKAWAANNDSLFIKELSLSLRRLLFFIIPVSALIFVFRAQIVRLIFGTLGHKGSFDWLATQLTASSVGIFIFGSIGSCMIPILARAFFASKDTKTPTIISLLCIALNIGLLIYFISVLGQGAIFEQALRKIMDLESIKDISVLAIALATAFSSTIQAILLIIFLDKKIKGILCKDNWIFIFKVCIALFFLISSSYAFLRIFEQVFDNKTVAGLFFQTGFSSLAGIGIYLIIGYILKIREANELSNYFSRKFLRKT